MLAAEAKDANKKLNNITNKKNTFFFPQVV